MKFTQYFSLAAVVFSFSIVGMDSYETPYLNEVLYHMAGSLNTTNNSLYSIGNHLQGINFNMRESFNLDFLLRLGVTYLAAHAIKSGSSSIYNYLKSSYYKNIFKYGW